MAIGLFTLSTVQPFYARNNPLAQLTNPHVAPPIVWTRFCESGHHSFSINLTNFKGTDLSNMKNRFLDFGYNRELDAAH